MEKRNNTEKSWHDIQDLYKKNSLTNGDLHIFEQMKIIPIGFGMK